ncbi:MerR family transcriptional regulator [Streptomyces sp. H51]|uniref:MerR family transcriptional regulator n=1 Tax=Streptomyces sp. H51 TaxID=3111770 RepID=UPI002D79D3A7|nr:MerR family transcriptional regulator [Streptomyces sp. H51]
MSRQDADGFPAAGVTTGFLARRLGVSPTTLRSWDRRYGLGPAARADGRHRRWSPDDIAMVFEMCRLTAAGIPPAEAARAAKERAGAVDTGTVGTGTVGTGTVDTGTVDTGTVDTGTVGTGAGGRVPASVSGLVRGAVPVPPDVRPAARASRSPSGLPLGDVRQECRGLARAAVRLDAAGVQEQLTSAVRTYGLVVAWEEILAPVLRAVGRKWRSAGDRYLEVEHLLSWHVSATLRHAYVHAAAAPRRPGTPPVLLACLPDEQHTLPLEALGAALAERGVPTIVLGGAVPAEALTDAMRRVGPGAAVLWSQSRSTADLPLARRLAVTRWGVRGARTHSAVLLSGPGWGRPQGSGLLRPRGLHEALRMLGTGDS